MTFVVHVHPRGVTTLENVSTDDRVQLERLEELAPQIERWMAASALPAERPNPPQAGATA